MSDIAIYVFIIPIVFLAAGCGLSDAFLSADPHDAGSGCLIGRSHDEVLDALGVPESISHGNEHSAWGYCDDEGRLHEDAILFHGDCVVKIHSDMDRFADPRPIPTSEPYLGQRVEDMVALLGAHESHSTGVFDLAIDYADMKIFLHGGRVVGIERY
jgi:hypothetical protein